MYHSEGKNGAQNIIKIYYKAECVAELSITGHSGRFQLCSSSYTALQVKNSIRRTSTISPVTTEIMNSSRDSQRCEIYDMLLQINTLAVVEKEMEHKEDKGESMMDAL